MKDTYNFKAKELARNRVYEFCSRNLSKDPSKSKVLTLLGHETSELEQIWLRLGVPYKNITVVEKDPKVYEIIKNHNLGINLIDKPMSMYEYLNSCNDKFFFINLDTTSQFGLDERDMIRKIAHRQLLDKNGVLITWFVGSREGGYNKSWFNKVYEDHPQINSTKYSESSVKGRSDLVSMAILASMIDGRLNYEMHPFLKGSRRNFYSKTLESVALEGLEKMELEKRGIDIENTLHTIGLGEFHRGPEATRLVKEMIKQEVEKQLVIMLSNNMKNVPACSRKAKTDESKTQWGPIVDYFTEMLYYQDIGSYFCEHHDRFRYISNKGVPMLVDMMKFTDENFKDVVRFKYKKTSPSLIMSYSNQKSNEGFAKFDNYRYKCAGEGLKPRQDISAGSEKRPKKEKCKPKEKNPTDLSPSDWEVIDSLIRENYNATEIASLFDGIRWQKIAARKIHLKKQKPL